jgi:hypothetical protein
MELGAILLFAAVLAVATATPEPTVAVQVAVVSLASLRRCWNERS